MFDKEHVGAFLWNRKTQDNEWGFAWIFIFA